MIYWFYSEDLIQLIVSRYFVETIVAIRMLGWAMLSELTAEPNCSDVGSLLKREMTIDRLWKSERYRCIQMSEDSQKLFEDFQKVHDHQMGVSWNGGTPSHHPNFSGIFHEKNHPFWGTPIYGNPQISRLISISLNNSGWFRRDSIIF